MALVIAVTCVTALAEATISGSWRTISAHESLTPPPEVAYDDQDSDAIKITVINGPEPVVAKLNGHFTPVKSNPDADAVAATRPNARTLVIRFKKGGRILTSRRVVAGDGKHMIVTDTGIGPKGRVNSVSVWEKISTDAATQPYVGRWQQQYIDMRLRPAPRYHFEVNGDEFLATSTEGLKVVAKSDGKEYPQKDGSIASVKRIDSNTYDITDKKGGELKWLLHVQVDQDGKHATVSWEPPSTISGKQAKVSAVLARVK